MKNLRYKYCNSNGRVLDIQSRKFINFVVARQRSCAKVIFSFVSVCLSVHSRGPHVTITHYALHLTVKVRKHPPPDIRHGPTGHQT